jgi:hypothetical protein
MAKIWKEKRDPLIHRNRMWDQYPVPVNSEGYITEPWVYFVRVCSFTFEFQSMEQIEGCLEYYSRKTHPSSRLRIGAADPWEMQRWFERLPMYLLEEPKRQRVVKALVEALKIFTAEKAKR